MARYRLVVSLDRSIPKAERLATAPPMKEYDSETELLAAISRHLYDSRVEVGGWERLPAEDAAA